MNARLYGYSEIADLGSGASGRVVRAVHDDSHTPVAIKYLAPRLAADPGFAERFRGEAQLLAGLRDENVVRFYEYVQWPGGAAIVMELVDGVTLRELLRSRGRLPVEAALVLLKGSLLGLAAAHGRGVVHRDYKPANVLVDGEGHSKLTDFGVAVRAGDDVPVEGTPAYLAPEQWAGAPAVAASDVYSATTVFFECLTGHRPFEGHETTGDLARAHSAAPVPVHEVDEPLQGLLASGLAKQPGQRPASAGAFVEQLDQVASEHYGADWERTGRHRLATLAGLLAASFPLALAPQVGRPEAGGEAAPSPELTEQTELAEAVDDADRAEHLHAINEAAEPAVPPSAPPSAPLRWPLIGVAAGGVAAVVVASVVIGTSGGDDEDAPPAAETAEPSPQAQTSAPGDDGDGGGGADVELNVDGSSASFSYSYEGCCEQQFEAQGRTSHDADGSPVDVESFRNSNGGPQHRGVVFPDQTYLFRADGSIVAYATPDVDEQSTDDEGAAEMVTVRKLAEVRAAVAPEELQQVLDDGQLTDERAEGDGRTYVGTTDAADAADDNGMRDLGSSFELTVDAEDRPVEFRSTSEYDLGSGQTDDVTITVSYTDWGPGGEISPPA